MVKTKRKNIEHFNPFTAIKNFFKGFISLAKSLANLFPLLFKLLTFIVIKIPAFIMKVLKQAKLFTKELMFTFFGVVITHLLITVGIVFSITNLMGYQMLDVIFPSLIAAAMIVIKMTLDKNDIIRLVQNIGLKVFVFFFTNPFIKMLMDFDVKIDPKNPQKNVKSIMKWIFLNLPQVVFALMIQLLVIKISLEKLWHYITFYMNNQ